MSGAWENKYDRAGRALCLREASAHGVNTLTSAGLAWKQSLIWGGRVSQRLGPKGTHLCKASP